MSSAIWHENWLRRIASRCSTGQIMISPLIKKDLLEANKAAGNKKRMAAVLIPLCSRNGVASVLFTKRSTEVGTHKGQVSFPGGHIDEKETAVEAAIREAYEELGFGIGDIDILGLCQTIPAITGTLVTPVLGILKNDVGNFESFTPNTQEVDEVFTHSVDELLSPGFRKEQWLERDGQKFKMPVFNEPSDNRVWGLTAMILDGVMKNAVLPAREHINS